MTIFYLDEIRNFIFIKPKYTIIAGVSILISAAYLITTLLILVKTKKFVSISELLNIKKPIKSLIKILYLTCIILIPSIPIIYGKAETKKFKIIEITIPVNRLPKNFNNFTIIHITDMHISHIVDYEYLKNVIKEVNSIDADIIILTGDYLTYYKDNYIEDFVSLLNMINMKDKTFGILGNHDIWSGEQNFRDAFKKTGIKLLINENIQLYKGNEHINIAGINSLSEGLDNLEKAIENINENDFTILLSHNPQIIEKAQKNNIDIIFSGHTHGGQIRLPFLGAIVTPENTDHKYQLGLYKINDTNLYISAGIGSVGLPIRLFCPPDISVITIVSESNY